MKKRSDKIKMLDGKNKTWQDIACLYLSHFKEGYTLTLDDLASYLRCGYHYIQRNVSWEIPHIYINSAANKSLYRFFTNEEFGYVEEEEEEYFCLITKKFLFHQKDVDHYLLNELKLITRDGEVENLKELPKLVSLKDLTNEDGEFFCFSYDSLVYRYIKSNDIPRIKFKNLIRYRWDDFS